MGTGQSVFSAEELLVAESKTSIANTRPYWTLGLRSQTPVRIFMSEWIIGWSHL